jgi:hypothetical protein
MGVGDKKIMEALADPEALTTPLPPPESVQHKYPSAQPLVEPLTKVQPAAPPFNKHVGPFTTTSPDKTPPHSAAAFVCK